MKALGMSRRFCLRAPYEFCGGLRVAADRALKEAASILEFDQNTVRLQATGSESGLYLDKYEQNSGWLIELVVWGYWKLFGERCAEKTVVVFLSV